MQTLEERVNARASAPPQGGLADRIASRVKAGQWDRSHGASGSWEPEPGVMDQAWQGVKDAARFAVSPLSRPENIQTGPGVYGGEYFQDAPTEPIGPIDRAATELVEDLTSPLGIVAGPVLGKFPAVAKAAGAGFGALGLKSAHDLTGEIAKVDEAAGQAEAAGNVDEAKRLRDEATYLRTHRLAAGVGGAAALAGTAAATFAGRRRPHAPEIKTDAPEPATVPATGETAVYQAYKRSRPLEQRIAERAKIATQEPEPPVNTVEEPPVVSATPDVETPPQLLEQVDTLSQNPIRTKEPEIVRDAEFESYAEQIRSVAGKNIPELSAKVDDAVRLYDEGKRGDAMVQLELARQQLHARGRELAEAAAKKAGVTIEQPQMVAETAATPPPVVAEPPKPMTYEAVLDDAVNTRLKDIEQEFTSGLLVGLTGKRKGADTSDYSYAGKEATDVGRFGGYKDQFPELSGIPETPGRIAEAIRKDGNNPLYKRVKQATQEFMEEQSGPQMKVFADQQQAALLGGGEPINFVAPESKAMLGQTADEAMTIAGAGRRPELLKEGKAFDDTRLVESELFQGRGGAQKFLGTDERADAPLLDASDDLSFDFGSNVVKALDDAEATTREAIRKSFTDLAKGQTLGAGLPVELIGQLVKFGAIKVAKGGVKFAQWSAEMIREFGDQVRPHLRDIFNRSSEYAAELRKFDPDEYFNFKRVSLSEAEQQALRSEVVNTVLETGRIPKERESWDTIRKEAEQLGPEVVDSLDANQKAQPELRGVRHAARQRINALNREIAEMRKSSTGLTEDRSLEAEKALAAKENDLRWLLNVWMRMRSEDGRNLAMHRMMADSTWDTAYWISRAKRSMGLPQNIDLPADVQSELFDIIARGDENLNSVRDTIRRIQGEIGDVRDKQPPANLPERTGPIQTLYGTQEAEIGKTPKTLPELKGAIQTLYGELETFEAMRQRYPDLPELEGAIKTVRGQLQTLEGFLDTQPVQALPDLSGPVNTIQGMQRNMADLRNGLQNVNAEKQRLAKRMMTLEKTGWLEAVAMLRKAGLLTGLKTHIRNIGGNASFQALEEISRIPGVIVDMALSMGTGRRTVQGVSPQALRRSTYEAATKGAKQALEVLKTGMSPDEFGKVGVNREMNTGIRWLDNYANSVFRAMSAEDKIFKSFAFRRSLEEQASLQAKERGVSALELLSHPSETMIAQAIADAEFATFNNRNLLSDIWFKGKSAARARGDAAGEALAFGMDFIVPFAQTPANIISRILDYTPVGSGIRASTAVGRAIINKGMTAEQQRAFSMAVGRGLAGSALMYLGWSLAEKGLMTGTYEVDEGQRNIAQAAGRLNGAIKVGDKWHRIAEFSPVGNLLTIGATFQREAFRPLRDEATRSLKVAAVATKTVMEQPMLQGIDETLNSLRNPDASRLASQQVGSFVPTLLNDAASLFDPYMRDPRPETASESIYQGAQARLPGLRNLLPPKMDVLGRPIANSPRSAVDPTIGSPVKEETDPASQILMGNKVGIGFSDRRPEEDSEEHQLRNELAGKTIDRYLRRLAERPVYQRADADRRRELVEDAIRDARNIVTPVTNRKFNTPAEKKAYLRARIQEADRRLRQ